MTMRALSGLAVLVVVTACAGVEPAGRNSRASPPPQASEPAPAADLPPAALTRQAPTPLPPPPPETAAPDVASDARVAPATAPQPRAEDDEIVVRGQARRQTPPPEGDPRSTAERMADVRAWDQCVSRAQAHGEIDPMRPALDTPEELCARVLGMAERFAMPSSRRE